MDHSGISCTSSLFQVKVFLFVQGGNGKNETCKFIVSYFKKYFLNVFKLILFGILSKRSFTSTKIRLKHSFAEILLPQGKTRRCFRFAFLEGLCSERQVRSVVYNSDIEFASLSSFLQLKQSLSFKYCNFTLN